ncbi:unnamed protein product, partial [Mesorhabditis spiculigera]
MAPHTKSQKKAPSIKKTPTARTIAHERAPKREVTTKRKAPKPASPPPTKPAAPIDYQRLELWLDARDDAVDVAEWTIRRLRVPQQKDQCYSCVDVDRDSRKAVGIEKSVCTRCYSRHRRARESVLIGRPHTQYCISFKELKLLRGVSPNCLYTAAAAQIHPPILHRPLMTVVYDKCVRTQ